MIEFLIIHGISLNYEHGQNTKLLNTELTCILFLFYFVHFYFILCYVMLCYKNVMLCYIYVMFLYVSIVLCCHLLLYVVRYVMLCLNVNPLNLHD